MNRTPEIMEASSPSSSNRTESAAEFVATVRKDHQVMTEWYNKSKNNSTTVVLRQLHDQYGSKYPESWKQVLNWNGWKDTRKAYLHHKEHSTEEEGSTATMPVLSMNGAQLATQTTTTNTTAPKTESDQVNHTSTVNTTTATAADNSIADGTATSNNIKQKRKSRWGNASTTTSSSSVVLPVANSAAATTTLPSNNYTDNAKIIQSAAVVGRNNDGSSSDGVGSKRGRWGTTSTTTNVAGASENHNNSNNNSELEQLRLQLRGLNYKIDHVVEETNRIDALPHDHRERSKSPPPIYGPDGKRQNTRAVRYKERYTTERQDLLEKLLNLTNQQQAGGNGIGSMMTPTAMNGIPGGSSIANKHMGALAGLLQYHKPTKKSEKIHIPVEKYPNYNFIGLIIGPRGKTQKELESKTGCKIAIRGKGSVKEGARGRRDGAIDTGDYEPLHVVVTGDDPRAVTAAATMIREMLIVIDDEKNVHKQQQLRELALLNGTLKDDTDGNSNAAMYCPICAEKGHRSFECPKRFNASASAAGGPSAVVKCAICGDTSHPTRDCKSGNATQLGNGSIPPPNQNSIDSEYQSFMAELDGKTTTPAVSLPLPPPPVDNMTPPSLPPPPMFVPASLPPQPTNVDGIPIPPTLPPPPLLTAAPTTTGLPLPPPPLPPLSSQLLPPPTAMHTSNLPPPPPIPPYQYQPPPQQPGSIPPHQQPYYQQYPPMSYPDQQQQQQQQQYNYGAYPQPGVIPPPQQQPFPPTTMVQPGEETATWDPNTYYGTGANNTGTSLNWWEQ